MGDTGPEQHRRHRGPDQESRSMEQLPRRGVGPVARMNAQQADVAQLVEHHLAKVRVAGSNPVVRSRESPGSGPAKGQNRVRVAHLAAPFTTSAPHFLTFFGRRAGDPLFLCVRVPARYRDRRSLGNEAGQRGDIRSMRIGRRTLVSKATLNRLLSRSGERGATTVILTALGKWVADGTRRRTYRVGGVAAVMATAGVA